MDKTDWYYVVLGLKPGATPEEAKRAYRDLVKVWHPDRFPNDRNLQIKAHEKLKEINEAFANLSSLFSRRVRPGLDQLSLYREKQVWVSHYLRYIRHAVCAVCLDPILRCLSKVQYSRRTGNKIVECRNCGKKNRLYSGHDRYRCGSCKRVIEADFT